MVVGCCWCWSAAFGFFAQPPPPVSLMRLWKDMNEHKVDHIQIDKSAEELRVYKTDGLVDVLPSTDTMVVGKILDVSVEKGIDVRYQPDNALLKTLTTFLPSMLFLAPLWFFMSQVMGRMVAPFRGNDGFALMDPSDMNTTFDEWGGSREVVREFREAVHLFNNPHPMVRAPKGILLEGPPGTGKTLLGRIVAKETNSSFISMSASEFVELFVGMGALRVRKLFEHARKNKPCILFLDEIDAIGQDRGRPGMGNEEREQTLNQLLFEMDGFHDNDGVMVFAATNRKDVLDEALLRPGRFDKIIHVPLPDFRSRQEILKIHCRGLDVEEGVDWDLLSRQMDGMSGADLAQVVNEACMMAQRANKTMLTQDALMEANERRRVGMRKETDDRSEESRKRVAVHEMGHVMMCLHNEECFAFQKVSIQQTFLGAGGYTMYTLRPEYADGTMMTKDLLKRQLQVLLGGRAAEKVFFGEDQVSVGAHDDIQKASILCRQMVGRFGMGSVLGSYVGHDSEIISEAFQSITDHESLMLLHQAYNRSVEVLMKHRSFVEDMTDELLFDNVLDATEINTRWTEYRSEGDDE